MWSNEVTFKNCVLESKFFLLHFRTFCLANFIDKQYFQSFNQLSVAMWLLCMKEVTGDIIKEAARLI